MTAPDGLEPRHFANLTHKLTVCGVRRGEVYEASRRQDVTCPACADVLDRATTRPAPDAAEHPSWCDRQHAAEWSAHSVQVGGDLELTNGLSYAVLLFQQGDRPTEVHLIRHTNEETSLTLLSLVEAGILRDLLAEGLQLVAGRAER